MLYEVMTVGSATTRPAPQPVRDDALGLRCREAVEFTGVDHPAVQIVLQSLRERGGRVLPVPGNHPSYNFV